ncbi:glycosyltransferase family 2 protein [Nonomuraea jiangxiensis]|uniref:Glycosyl transferase family 2 n=1 Tax=Nonomuraea jiangxiensis TaxID=633440 RepID=A0A1G8MFH6_9ACTN|nr:glycosyltransferase family A protein [Nonomuraea jiangxiensis]SDI66622.1 Glycosyl transferase family 2 [Nonomuraea jiangxiensis]
MNLGDTLVSMGLPVYNGADRVEKVVHSVLGQDHPNLELVICDNASTDRTEEICRDLAATDARIVYHRQPSNIGQIPNFSDAIARARGTFYRWVGDDNWLAPDYVSRCLRVFEQDERLLLVTTQQAYTGPDGSSRTVPYSGSGYLADDPVDRFSESLRMLNEDPLAMDPLYSLMRREGVLGVNRGRVLLREDEIFAARMALAGPWGHVPEILAGRTWEVQHLADIARKIGAPSWHVRFATALQCRELLRALGEVPLTPAQRRRGRAVVARMYLRRHGTTATRRGRKLMSMAATLVGR